MTQATTPANKRVTPSTRAWPEAIAWTLWVLAFLIVLVPSYLAINKAHLPGNEPYIAVIQFAAIGWLLLIPSAYFWRRGGGHTHLDGLIWSFIVLVIFAVIVVLLSLHARHGFPGVWGVLFRPIPLSKIF